MADEGGSGTVKSADRVLQILELLSQERDGLSFADVCLRLGLCSRLWWRAASSSKTSIVSGTALG